MSVSPADRRYRIEHVAIGLVAIVALALGAATITSLSAGEAGAPGSGEEFTFEHNLPELDVPGVASNYDFGGDGTTGILLDLSWCSAFLTSGLGSVVYFGAFGGVLYGLKRRYSLGTAAFGAYGLSPIVLIAYFMSTSCATGGGPREGPGGPGQPPAEPGPILPEPSPLLLVGVLGFVLVGATAVLYRVTREETDEGLDPVEPEPSHDRKTDVADLAAAASAAADRLEAHNADVDNEVYRAWWEMTTLLDVPNPHSSTPGEFADAAVELGMRREDVEELTRLFEEVRYGGRDPETREERAIDVFRAIGEAYGDG